MGPLSNEPSRHLVCPELNWKHPFQSWSDPGRFAHPNSPAGGSEPGVSRPPGPLGSGDDWPLFSSVPHPDSPADRHYVWQLELPLRDTAARARAVYDAITFAPRYVPQALCEATGQELGSIVGGIVPGLLMFLGVLAASTALGAGAGAAIGALAFGVGAAPGAAIGGELGFDAGIALLEFLGLTILVAYIGKSLWDAATVAGDAVQTAWHSVDNRRTQQLEIDHAAHRLAFAVGLVFRGMLQGIVQFLLAKGTAAAASRVPELVSALRRSKLGAGFAGWVERNWQGLVKNPKLQLEKGTGPGGADGDPQSVMPSKRQTSQPQRPGTAEQAPKAITDPMKFPEGIPPEEGARLTQAARSTFQIQGRNVAVAETDVDGTTRMLTSLSGRASPEGTVPAPADPLFTTKSSGAMTRAYDSEVKILEDVARNASPDSQGTVSLYTERPPCLSCQGVIQQFRQQFPGIKVIVTHGP